MKRRNLFIIIKIYVKFSSNLVNYIFSITLILRQNVYKFEGSIIIKTYIFMCRPYKYPFSLFPSSLQVGSEGEATTQLWKPNKKTIDIVMRKCYLHIYVLALFRIGQAKSISFDIFLTLHFFVIDDHNSFNILKMSFINI